VAFIELLAYMAESTAYANAAALSNSLERIGWLEKKLPDKPQSRKQKYRLGKAPVMPCPRMKAGHDLNQTRLAQYSGIIKLGTYMFMILPVPDYLAEPHIHLLVR